MLADETCWFLAIDFDKKTWHRDVAVFLATCQALGVPAALERSRSGNGGHMWIFFTHPVPAASARRLGAWLLTESMERNPDIGFESYDRLFPNQDTLPAGGFGNLIALPLQHQPRRADNSVFLDDDLQPHVDQWRYLSSVRRMSPAEVARLTDEAGRRGRILGVRLPVVEEDEAPWLAPPSRKRTDEPIAGPLPETVEVVLGDQVYVGRAGLPASLVNRLARLAAFQNPEFYSAQGMRLPHLRYSPCHRLRGAAVAPRGAAARVPRPGGGAALVTGHRRTSPRRAQWRSSARNDLRRRADAGAGCCRTRADAARYGSTGGDHRIRQDRSCGFPDRRPRVQYPRSGPSSPAPGPVARPARQLSRSSCRADRSDRRRQAPPDRCRRRRRHPEPGPQRRSR